MLHPVTLQHPKEEEEEETGGGGQPILLNRWFVWSLCHFQDNLNLGTNIRENFRIDLIKIQIMLYAHYDAGFVRGIAVYGADCSGDHRPREISLSVRVLLCER
jgi:hypothetical protein